MLEYIKKLYKINKVKNTISIAFVAFTSSVSTYILAYALNFPIYFSYFIPFVIICLLATTKLQDNRMIFLLFSYALLSFLDFLVFI
ncbi:MAG: hypothetical protein QXS81_00360 [Candidatus Micrarchaeaceae archaeon]